MTQWICPNCGFPNDATAKKCWICGGRKQSQDFITATATAENRKAQPKEKKELPAAKESNRKPTLYDLHKDRVGELYAQGWTVRQIQAEIEISKRSIQTILARLVKEM